MAKTKRGMTIAANRMGRPEPSSIRWTVDRNLTVISLEALRTKHAN
jgi:hypothetical protein